MIVVTGAAGFIGSNIIQGLNEAGHSDILAVDDLTQGVKFHNLVHTEIMDYWDKDDFLTAIKQDAASLNDVTAIFHQGACSDTTEDDGRYMLAVNYEYSKALLHFCQNHGIPLIYASSAAIYGDTVRFKETPDYECPLNIYGYSKYLFDHYVRRLWPNLQAPVTGLRYFNVYGPGEWHKGKMASVAYHLHQQLKQGDEVQLFGGCHGYGPGEQRRDFVYVRDAVAVNLWCWRYGVSGIFNVGTGQSHSFNELADAVIDWHGRGRIKYIDFPKHLLARYQSFTEADISALRQAGYPHAFYDVKQGVQAYLDHIEQKQSVGTESV